MSITSFDAGVARISRHLKDSIIHNGPVLCVVFLFFRLCLVPRGSKLVVSVRNAVEGYLVTSSLPKLAKVLRKPVKLACVQLIGGVHSNKFHFLPPFTLQRR